MRGVTDETVFLAATGNTPLGLHGLMEVVACVPGPIEVDEQPHIDADLASPGATSVCDDLEATKVYGGWGSFGVNPEACLRVRALDAGDDPMDPPGYRTAEPGARAAALDATRFPSLAALRGLLADNWLVEAFCRQWMGALTG